MSASAPASPRVRAGVAAVLTLLGLFITLQVLTRNEPLSDDAWISFRYSANLVRGDGLVWNPGYEAVEGYSNLLWVLLGALGLALGVPMVAWIQGLSIALWCGSTALAYWAARLAGAGRPAALLAAALTATSGSIAGVVGIGLESPLVMGLFTLGTALAMFEERSIAEGRARFPWSALAFGLLTLAHVEGPFYLVVPLLIRLSRRWSAPGAAPDHRGDIARLSLALDPVLAQLLLRVFYYHDWIPNPIRIKIMIPSMDLSWAAGIRYVLLSLTYNPLLGALVVLGGISAFALRRDADRPAQTGTLALLLPWLACAGFSALARGDMLAQLRFMAPATPTLMALCAVGLERLVRRLPYTFALAGAAAVLVWAGASARQDLSTRVITPSRNRAGFGEGALAELSQPLGQVRMFEPPLGRLWGDAPRWVVSPVPWYFAWIMENIPQGGCVLFPDVGLLGFGLYDGLVLDARGLNSRGPARLLASQPEEGPAGMLNPGVQAFLQEFAQIRPAGLVLQAMDGRVWGPMEAALQGAGALDSYRGVATGSYVGQRNVRVYTLDVEPPSAEVVLERYRRLAKMAPGTFDWEGRLSELMSGRAKPAEHGQDTSEVWLYPAGEWSRAATGRPNAGSMRR